MNSISKITVLVSIQIILIIASFLTLSLVELEEKKLADSILILSEIRHQTESLMFETEQEIRKIPYAHPKLTISKIWNDMELLRHGNDVINPLSSKYFNAYDSTVEKLNIFTNHIQEIIDKDYSPNQLAGSEFLILDTEKFDASGSLAYLISLFQREHDLQSSNIIVLEYGFAIFNVGIHVLMIMIILNILKKQSEREVRFQKFASIGELAARISHDLRNPLSVIKMGVDLLISNNPSLPEEKRIARAKMVNNAISRMTHQLEDVMDFVRISNLNLENGSIQEIIDASIRRITIPDSVKLTLPKTDYTLNCDRIRIETVFVNLLTNALDAIDKNGTIEIKFKDTKNYLEIYFQDSGPGIEQENMSKVFEPLFTSKQHGTGLGLASCKNILKEHNGTITFSNNPTTFLLKIPKNL
ncbi:MAG: HAMP domain-containing histidine kinase [Nitrosopumilus sp.]|nr:HAMP domain-containing histidine kinase [Nitrosopumilus sp.]